MIVKQIVKRVSQRLRDYFKLQRPVNKKALIVLGKEKCGTTAIAALLAKRTGQSVTLDIPPLWNEAESKIRRGQLTLLDFIQQHSEFFANSIVKEPCLTFMAEQVFEIFVREGHVVVVRDPRDNIRSVFDRLGFPGDQEQLPGSSLNKIPRGWQTVIDPQWNQSPSTQYVEVQAYRWNVAVDVLLTSNLKLNAVRYEDFMADKTATIDDLAQRVGLPIVNEIADDLEKQYQPPGDPNVSWREFFGEVNLARIEDICAPRMTQLGYTVSK